MNPNQYLNEFFGELERLVDGHGTRHAVSTTRIGELEVRLGNGNWYRVMRLVLDVEPIQAARDVARRNLLAHSNLILPACVPHWPLRPACADRSPGTGRRRCSIRRLDGPVGPLRLFLDCARHLQGGYVDQPVLTPLLARVCCRSSESGFQDFACGRRSR